MAPRRAFLAFLASLSLLSASPRPATADFESAKKLFLDNVKSPDWKARRSGFLALGDHDGGPAAALILAALPAETNPAVLAGALDALSNMRSSAVRAALLDALRRGRPTERLHAILALSSHRGSEVDGPLVEALSTGAPPLAAQAAIALGVPGHTGAEAALVKALQDDHEQVRIAAARSLASLGTKDAVKPLSERLRLERGRARWETVRALEAITGQKFGDAMGKWLAFASGGDPSKVDEKPVLPPTFFGVPVTGERVAFVLDRSILMGDPHPFNGAERRERLEKICSPPDGDRIPYRLIKSKLQLAVAHLLHAVDGMPSGDRFEVVTFCKEVRGVFGLHWTPVSAATKKALAESLKALDVDDGIDLWDALNAALDLGGPADDKAWKAGPEEVFLVTNNVATAGEVKDADGIGTGIALKARLRMVSIHVVGIGNHPFALAETLAKKSFGTYVNLSK